MTIEQLAAKVAAAPINTRGRRLFGDKLRRELVAAFAASGLSRREFSERVGVSGMSVFRWSAAAKEARRTCPRGSFKTVAVDSEPPTSVERIRIRAPGGVVVEDLSVAAVADLLVALAKRASC